MRRSEPKAAVLMRKNLIIALLPLALQRGTCVSGCVTHIGLSSITNRDETARFVGGPAAAAAAAAASSFVIRHELPAGHVRLIMLSSRSLPLRPRVAPRFFRDTRPRCLSDVLHLNISRQRCLSIQVSSTPATRAVASGVFWVLKHSPPPPEKM